VAKHFIVILIMVFRQATIQDVTSIKALLAQLGYPDLTVDEVKEKIEAYAREHYYLIVSEIDKKVVGFVALHWIEVMHFQGKLGRITAFCVDENFRSKEIGTRMLAASESFLQQQGCFKIEVASNIRRNRSHKFYLERGYVEDSKRFTKYF
jgi:N-acetylglutamate synthase-like GNAT family acetyltransferase